MQVSGYIWQCSVLVLPSASGAGTDWMTYGGHHCLLNVCSPSCWVTLHMCAHQFFLFVVCVCRQDPSCCWRPTACYVISAWYVDKTILLLELFQPLKCLSNTSQRLRFQRMLPTQQHYSAWKALTIGQPQKVSQVQRYTAYITCTDECETWIVCMSHNVKPSH